jgi:two-component system NtrC family sensor kinase
MSEINEYKVAYEREREARLLAERQLEEKTRNLYEGVSILQNTVDELEETQEKLIQSEKMASLGQLAAGIAHEINNPIGFTLSNINTMVDYVDDLLALDSLVMEKISTLESPSFVEQYQKLRLASDIDFIIGDIKELINDSLNGLKRVGDIVANLKKVSHVGELEKDVCNINEVVSESLKVVASELKYNMEVNTHFNIIPDFSCHSGEITQVFMNLFINASHACEDKGMLDITTCVENINDKQCIVIKVQDNGKGMSKEVARKVFDPFFTTKPIGVGTGLGLSVSFGIIEKHGGTIAVKSIEGKGTIFTINLPL